MNFKKFHESKNLFDKDNATMYDCYVTSNGQWATGAGNKTVRISCASNTQYTLSTDSTYSAFRIMETNSDNIPSDGSPVSGTLIYYGSGNQYTFTTSNTAKYIIFQANSASPSQWLSELMLNTGSTPQPYEPYSSEVWHDIPYYQHKTATDTLTLPAVIYPNDTTVTVGIKGNATQSGTPTPDNPIMPQGTGERTGNLFDYVAYFDSTFTAYNQFFNYATVQLKPNTTYTLSTSIIEQGSNPRNTAFIVTTTNQTPTTASGGLSNVSPITITTESDGVLKLYKRISGLGVIPTKAVFDNGDWIMLNTGSTALPYEPYGYKIPISSANTTTPVYLGEVETTRKIKKLVFNGNENIGAYDSTYNRFSIIIPDSLIIGVRLSPVICSHYQAISDGRGIANVPNNAIYSDSGTSRWFIKTTEYTNATDFKAYLAQQYAAGTPVCVWYVLATPQTAVVNEPLMRIGDYADTLSDVSIPVTAGGDTLSVGTTVQPSEVTVNYKGWHPVADVHKRNNGAWT